MFRQSFMLGIVCLLGLGVLGCGQRKPKLTPVEGKVIYKGLLLAGVPSASSAFRGRSLRASRIAAGISC